ncbi:MAG: hypothetical protein RBR97_16990 [Bacteroidales bacterium]|nr:hypothetical protein [Bacteroidales bacterium]
MNKLIITQSKDVLAVFKIYINDTLVEKIGPDETKEIDIADSIVRIQAKCKGGYRSQKKLIDVSKVKRIEVIVNPKITIHPLMIFSPALLIFVFAMNHEKFLYLKVIFFALFLFLILGAIIQWIKISKNGVLIEEIDYNKI